MPEEAGKEEERTEIQMTKQIRSYEETDIWVTQVGPLIMQVSTIEICYRTQFSQMIAYIEGAHNSAWFDTPLLPRKWPAT